MERSFNQEFDELDRVVNEVNKRTSLIPQILRNTIVRPRSIYPNPAVHISVIIFLKS
jgi:hypothetical protein